MAFVRDTVDVSGLKVPAVSVYVLPVAFNIKLPVKVTIAPPDLFITKSQHGGSSPSLTALFGL